MAPKAAPALEHWALRYADLLRQHLETSSAESRLPAADLGRALGAANIPLADIAGMHSAALQQQLGTGGPSARAVLGTAAPLLEQVLTAYDAVKRGFPAARPATDDASADGSRVDRAELSALNERLQRELAERSRTEQALRDSEECFRQLAENIREVFWLAEPGSRKLLYVSPAYEHFMGHSSEELKSNPDAWLNHIHAEDRPRVTASVAEQAQGAVTEHECRVVRPDGSVRWMRNRSFPVRNEAGAIYRLAGLAEDITERKHAEDALRASKEFLDQIINSLADPIFVKDREHRMVLVNDAECALAGRPRDQIIGQTDYAFFPREQVDVFWEVDEAVFASGAEHTNEEELTDARGETHTLVTRKTRYTDEGGQQFIVGVIRDITERKRAEEALRASEERFRALCATAPVGIFLADGETRCLYVNPCLQALTGLTLEACLAYGWQQVLHPDDRAAVRSEIERTQRDGSEFARDFRLRRPDGSERWVHARTTSISGHEGTVRLRVGVVEDITERRQTEHLLRIQRDLAVALSGVDSVEAALDRVLRAALEIEGLDCGGVYLVDEATGSLELAVHANLSPEFIDQVAHLPVDSPQARLVASGQPIYWPQPDIVITPELFEREGLHCLVSIPILFQGQAVAVLNVSSHTLSEIPRETRHALESAAARVGNIVGRVRAESALRKSEESFRVLTETTTAGVCIGRSTRIEYVNSATEAITGYTRAELTGLNFWDVIHPEHRDLVRERSLARQQGEPVPSRYEVKLLTKAGAERWVELSASRFEYAGEPATLATIFDITDRKEAEAAARQHQEELARVARVSTMGEMASGLAHELSQPLSAILYYAKSCLTRLGTGTWGAAEAANALRKIAVQAERAGAFIQHLKAFVRKAQPTRVRADVNAIVRQSVSFAVPDARQRQIPIRLELADDLPPVVIDPIQIEQVLLNLLRNAVEALERTPEDERLLVVRTQVGSAGTVQVRVSDTGRGLTPEIAAQVFDPFFTTKAGGTGLGLSISRSIIEAHDGELWLQADPQHGSTFGFTLPVSGGNEHASA